MELAKGGPSLACTTKELRDIAREAHRQGLNRQMTPAQFKLLDPRGTHILSPQFMHNRIDGVLTDVMHLRMLAYLKLLGKQQAVERMIDVPLYFVEQYVDVESLIERGLATKAMEGDNDVEGFVQRYEEALRGGVGK
jgi:hypothetical protein